MSFVGSTFCFFPLKSSYLSSDLSLHNHFKTSVMSLTTEQAGKRMDKLITSSITQVGVSLAWGAVASLIFFKRKSWPILVGAGFGVGASFADISNEVNLNS